LTTFAGITGCESTVKPHSRRSFPCLETSPSCVPTAVVCAFAVQRKLCGKGLRAIGAERKAVAPWSIARVTTVRAALGPRDERRIAMRCSMVPKKRTMMRSSLACRGYRRARRDSPFVFFFLSLGASARSDLWKRCGNSWYQYTVSLLRKLWKLWYSLCTRASYAGEKLEEGSMVLLPCGHTYCNRASSYASARVTECSKCQQAVAGAGGAVWRACQTWRR